VTIEEALVTGILSFFFGLISGLLIQRVKFDNDRRLDKIRRIMPHAEIVHPILESLTIDVAHAHKLLEKNDDEELTRYLARTAKDFESFNIWFLDFAEKGMKPEMESLNYNLHKGLNGVNVFCQMIRNHGTRYIPENITEIQQTLWQTQKFLNEFLRS
jgi:hypothetical protein